MTHGDNQQATPVELAWLAGLTDGEGTIGLYRYIVGKHVVLKPRFQITTTSSRLVKRILDILEPIGVRLYVSQAEQRPNWKEKYVLATVKHEACETVIRLLMPYLVEKTPQAELLLGFLASRKTSKYGDGYSEEEYAALDALKETNFRGVNVPRLTESSEAKRETRAKS